MFILLVAGCTKDNSVSPPPTPPQKTYNFLAVFAGKGDVTPDKVNNLLSGAKVPLTIVAETGYVIASVKVNGVPMEGIPKGATSFNLNVTITSDTQVEVAFISDRLFLLTTLSNSKPWKQVSEKCYKAEDNTYLCSLSLTEEEKQLEYTYVYPEMKRYLANPQKGTTSNMPFVLSNNLLTLDVTDYWITEITPSILSYKTSSRIDPNLGNIYFIRTFNRQ